MINSILQSKINWLTLILSLLIIIPIGFGLLISLMLIAWLLFGEGSGSRFYDFSTTFIVTTITMFSIILTNLAIIKKMVKNKKLENAKAILISSVIIVILYFTILFI